MPVADRCQCLINSVTSTLSFSHAITRDYLHGGTAGLSFDVLVGSMESPEAREFVALEAREFVAGSMESLEVPVGTY